MLSLTFFFFFFDSQCWSLRETDISKNELNFICKKQDKIKSACNISPVDDAGMLAKLTLGLAADAAASSREH